MSTISFDGGEPIRWLRECADDPRSPARVTTAELAALTGQDTRALRAIGATWELYACGDDAAREAALFAVRHLIATMQPKCRPLARELIARSLDWSDRDPIWKAVLS